MPVIKSMKDLKPFLNTEIRLKNEGAEQVVGVLIALCFVGKTKKSIGKAWVEYKKENGLPGNKGVNIFPDQTIIETG